MEEIIVEIPGVGEVAFPASMNMDEINQQVRRLAGGGQAPQSNIYTSSAPGITVSFPLDEAPAQERPSLGNQAARQLGLATRGAVTGVAGLPMMAGDALNQLINKITGSSIPPASQSLQNLMTNVGVPTPQTGTERVAQDIVAGMTGVGTAPAIARGLTQGGQRIMAPLLERLGTQTLASGAAAGTAGGIREGGGGAGAQMAGGLTAGMLAPSTVGLMNVGRSTARSLTQPFSQTGQEQMAGRLLREQATDPLQAMRNMEMYTPQIPGSQPTMAATAQDYGLASFERTASQIPEGAGRYAQRLAQNNQARNVLLEKYTTDKVLTDAIVKRDEVTSGIRTRAFADSTPVKPSSVIVKIEQILKSPVGAREMVRSQLNDIKSRIQAEVNEGGFSNPARLYSVRQDIADIIEGNVIGSKAENTRKVASKQLIEIRQALDDIIESGAPGYQEYLRMYRTMSRPVSQIKEMQNIVSKASGGTVDPTTGVRNFTPVRFGKLVEQMEADTRNPLSKTQMGVLKKVSKELDDGAMMNLPGIKPAGSDTFKNITVGNLLGNISANSSNRGVTTQLIESFARPISWIYRGGEDAVKQLLVDAMLDPKLAAQLMRKATPQNIQEVGRSLAQKATQATYGSAFGTAVAQ